VRLTTHLLTRIVISGTAALVGIVAWIVVTGHSATQAELERTATAAERILELQMIGFTRIAGLEPGFPYWYPVSQIERSDGACIRLTAADGAVLRSSCSGRAEHRSAVPQWFMRVYELAFSPADSVTRGIDGRGRAATTLEVIPNAEVETAAAWKQVEALAIPAGLLIAVLCLNVWWSVRRAIQPTQTIMAGLSAIEQGHRDTRLGPFAFTEFDRIASACNNLAASLAASDAARAALSRQLLKVQEEERHTLARELHDEFGQHLSALSANAAALRTALDDPTMLADVQRIETSAGRLMEIVRSLLGRLRPWSADAAELPESLRVLAGGRTTGTGKTPRVDFSINGRLDDLPPVLAGAIYRIVQEGLTNALRHGDPDHVAVRIRRAGSSLELAIEDDGSGCEPAALAGGFGIAGIRERATALGASLGFVHKPQGGLVLNVRFDDTLTELAAA
jgi:signal transduction histidine kinase